MYIITKQSTASKISSAEKQTQQSEESNLERISSNWKITLSILRTEFLATLQ